MDQFNAVIDCDVSRLDFPLRAMKARTGHNFVALIRRAPADVTGLFVRVFRADGVSYFDVTAHEHPGGEWVARMPAACFPMQPPFGVRWKPPVKSRTKAGCCRCRTGKPGAFPMKRWQKTENNMT